MDAAKVAAIASGNQGLTQSRGRKIWRYCAGTVALVATLSLAGCYGPPLSTRAEGTLIGGAAGVGGGALVGSAGGSHLAWPRLRGLRGSRALYPLADRIT